MEDMLRERGIRRGVEVFVKSRGDPDLPEKKSRENNTYPHHSIWLVVKY